MAGRRCDAGRARSSRRAARPRRRVLRRADAARRRELPDQRPDGAAARSSPPRCSIKQACARANASLGRLDRPIADAIVAAADEILAGALRDQFVVDVYQAGAGTSHNMNTNEVLANRAARDPRRADAATTRACTRTITSTWDSRPTTCSRRRRGWRSCCVLPDLAGRGARRSPTRSTTRRAQFAGVLKTGRTHLQDAVPITLGQEFGGYAANVAHAAEELEHAASSSCTS